jgi:N6-L-threonylcarbamoyladenine synthase
MIILGIETSCDETAAAICKNGRILSSIVSSQSIHSQYGGVVPEIASREHERLLNLIVHNALNEAGTNLTDLNAISVTHGPGLAGALLTGVTFAKGLALGLDIPLIPINHLEAHIYANFLADSSLKYPFVCLLVLGGHTQLWHVKKMDHYILLGETRDDAAGEAFDKGARIFGLGYPGGPAIEQAAKGGNPCAYSFPRGLMNDDSLEFSFSGLKTSLLYFMDDYRESQTMKIQDVIASYQEAIVESLVEKMRRAIHITKTETGVIAGGVAANERLRECLSESLPNIRILFPDLTYCTDNAAMVGYLGEQKINSGMVGTLEFDVKPNLSMS